ncbi:hypothetical protein CSIM01_13879 [Colletotrichum simmondsii]|uniref:Uncharacterized protein n=1 Tax=Colletotrichum simmondsii TaxID=703756 RepID=A0A135TFH2_9PEZI|nr:hypothetical protein CSIM01_13879 [Colletotrichum simmondsii]
MNNALAMVNNSSFHHVNLKQVKCAISGIDMQDLTRELDELESTSIANDPDTAIAAYIAAHSTRSEVRSMASAIITASMFLRPAARDPFVQRRIYPLVRTTAGRLRQRAQEWFTAIRQTPTNASIDFIVSFDTSRDAQTNYCDYVCVTVFTDWLSWNSNMLRVYVSDFRSFTWSGLSVTHYRDWIIHILDVSIERAGPDLIRPDRQIVFEVENSLNTNMTRRKYEDKQCCAIAAVIETYTGSLDDRVTSFEDALRLFLDWLRQEQGHWASFRTTLANFASDRTVRGDRRDPDSDALLVRFVKEYLVLVVHRNRIEGKGCISNS